MYELNSDNIMNKFGDDIRKMIGDFSILWNLYEKSLFKDAEEKYRIINNKRKKW